MIRLLPFWRFGILQADSEYTFPAYYKSRRIKIGQVFFQDK